LQVLLPTIILISGFFVAIASLVFRAQLSKPTTGSMGLVGEIGIVKKALKPEGKVFVHGELWNARAKEPLDENVKVRVVKVVNLILEVESVDEGVYQQRDVRGAVPERRRIDGKDVESVVQILSKGAGIHQRGEFALQRARRNPRRAGDLAQEEAPVRAPEEQRQDAAHRLAEQHGGEAVFGRRRRMLCTHFAYKCTRFAYDRKAVALPG